ncbi:GNAT family N-acetyltransferase [Streptomyces sp. NBC_00444]|uniref:GNAT family N-acetyltransferase n=1 Tax=Streptomyces sp. NBC_00444 TaxID=2975744 RepID=UPI002E1FAF4B
MPVGLDTGIRHVRDTDWPEIAALETTAYAGSSLSEGQAALESKGHASPHTCFVVDIEGRIAGYLLALPYPMFQYPGLAQTEEPAHHSRNLHLHDVVVAPEQRGRGWGSSLLRRLTGAAQPSYERISLIAVDGMAAFWASRGFRALSAVRLPESYGDDAVYMSMALRGSSASPSKEVVRFPCLAS